MTESTATGIDPSNVEQLGAWDGDTGAYWAAHADRFDEGIAGYHGQFLAAAAIDATANVLDIGCGSGQTTRDAAQCATAGSALGVDPSSRMIERARQLAKREQVANATFHQADAQVYPFPDQSFDIAISRTGAMFFGDALAAFTNIARALRPGGRLLLLAWQSFQQNEWFSTFFTTLAAGRELSPPPPGTPGPFSLSDPDRVRRLLTSAGFIKAIALRRIADMLRPGGVLRLWDVVYSFEPADAERRIEAWIAETMTDDIEHGWTRAELAEHFRDEHSTFTWVLEPMIKRAGFDMLDTNYSASSMFARYLCRKR